uniref:Chondroitin proteoglycan 4 domain-containing protein n=1 Tax=Strongyloides stercoralis TaxID=6248 RepID=A0A0K0EGI6_STRER
MKNYFLFWFYFFTIYKFLYSSKQFDNSYFNSKKEQKNDAVNNCVLKCKDEHMKAMGNEWASDFTFPLINLVSKNASLEIAYLKAQEICHENKNMKKCLDKCTKSDEKKLLLLGLKPWEDVCRNLKQLKPHFSCWKKNINFFKASCYNENLNLTIQLGNFSKNKSTPFVKVICSSFDKLSDCSLLEYKKYCGSTTTNLLKKFYQISKYAVNDMLKIKFTTLPEECENENDRKILESLELNFSIKKVKIQFLSFFITIFCLLLFFL